MKSANATQHLPNCSREFLWSKVVWLLWAAP